jgi:hypothetical protein
MNKVSLLLATFSLGFAVSVACDGDGGANACERAGQRWVDRFEECGGEVQSGDGGGESVECTDALAAQANCAADCAEAADCDIVSGDYDVTDPDVVERLTEYGECVQAC